MLNKTAAWTFGLSVLVSPLLAFAQSADVEAQTTALLGQVQQLQAQIAALQTKGSPSSCPVLSRTLAFGSRGNDVASLQTYLIAKGYLAAGSNTGYFGLLTQAAVQAYQSSNGIASSGTPSTTGYGMIGPKTRALLTNQCAQTPTAPTVQNLNTLQANPGSGTAPLAVHFSATDTNHEGGTYTIDFGDGIQTVGNAQCGGGTCTIVGDHTYVRSGTFTAHVLYTAPCPAAPGGDCASILEPIASAQVTVSDDPAHPASVARLTASPASGTKAPLDVTFTINGTGNFVLDFGDGSQTALAGNGGEIRADHRYVVTYPQTSSTYTAKLLSNGTVLDSAAITVSDQACANATAQLMKGQIDGDAFAAACY